MCVPKRKQTNKLTVIAIFWLQSFGFFTSRSFTSATFSFSIGLPLNKKKTIKPNVCKNLKSENEPLWFPLLQLLLYLVQHPLKN